MSQIHRNVREINFVLVNVPSCFSLSCGMRLFLCSGAMLCELLNVGSWVPYRDNIIDSNWLVIL